MGNIYTPLPIFTTEKNSGRDILPPGMLPPPSSRPVAPQGQHFLRPLGDFPLLLFSLHQSPAPLFALGIPKCPSLYFQTLPDPTSPASPSLPSPLYPISSFQHPHHLPSHRQACPLSTLQGSLTLPSCELAHGSPFITFSPACS